MEITYQCHSCGKKNTVDIADRPTFGLGSSGIGALEIGSPVPFSGFGNMENMMGYLQNKPKRPLKFTHYCEHCDKKNIIEIDE